MVICRSRGKKRREVTEVAILLLLLLAVFFGPAVFGGRVLLPTDLVFDFDPLWQPLAPRGYTQPSNSALSDQAYQFLPWKAYTVRSLTQGCLPLWNPYVESGHSFVGNGQSAIFDPLNLLGLLFPLYSSFVVTAILRLFVAGFFTFLFAREIGIGKPGALLAMVAFTFSGPMVGWVGYPLSSVVVWLPAMLLAIERALVRKSGLYVVVCGLTIGAQFLAGHPETSFQVIAAWMTYGLYRAVALEGWRRSQLVPQLVRIAAALALGLLLAAVQLFPFIEALLRSAVLVSRLSEGANTPSLVTRIVFEWQQWAGMINILLPQYFGTPLDDSYWFPNNNYVEQSTYVGVLPLTLGITALIRIINRRSSSRRGLILFWALLAILSLGVALGLPVLNVVNYLPVFNVTGNGRLRLVFALAASLLAGVGLDELRDPRVLVNFLRILISLALVSLCLIVLAYVGFVLFKEDVIYSGRTYMEARWGTPGFSRPLEYYYGLVEERYDKKLTALHPRNVVMYLPVLIALVSLMLYGAGRKLRTRSRVWAWAILGLTILDLFLVGLPFNPTTAPEHIFPTPGALRFLQQDPGIYRVVGTDLVLNPNSGMLFGLSDVRGYEPMVSRRYVDLISRMEGYFSIHHHSLFAEPKSPLLDLLNVKYVLTEQELEGRWELVYQDQGSVRVYRNRDVLPRAFFLHRTEVVPSAARSLERVTEGDFDFRERIVLEESPSNWVRPPEIPPSSSARIVEYTPNRVRVEVETAADGLLLLTDSYAPGWKALVDGQTRPLYVADHAFRAVVVPAGVHQVEFLYRPLSFRLGAVVSLFTWCGVIVAVITLTLRQQSKGTLDRSSQAKNRRSTDDLSIVE